jgi:hypothetical protein
LLRGSICNASTSLRKKPQNDKKAVNFNTASLAAMQRQSLHADEPPRQAMPTSFEVFFAGLALPWVARIGRFYKRDHRTLMSKIRQPLKGHVDLTLGHRGRRRLEAHPDFLDVILLAEADRRAHERGYPAPTLDEAIAILRELEGRDED